MKGNELLPCGQCLGCKVNRRRVWVHRILLESCLHESSSFVTLTYGPEHLPADGSLVPEHLSDFIKRLRDRLAPLRFRFFGVGEYGERGMRPHFHVILFGVGPEYEEELFKAWGLGFVHVGSLTAASAQYCAGYTVKKMTSAADPRLGGLRPEFARMSRRPGIGFGAVPQLAAHLMTRAGSAFVAAQGDVPASTRFDQKVMPLGRFLRGKLRYEVGSDSDGSPEASVFNSERKAALSAMQDRFSSRRLASLMFAWSNVDDPGLSALASREHIYSKRGVL